MKYLRLLIVAILMLVALFIGHSVYQYIDHRGKIPVFIKVIPSKSELSIDGTAFSVNKVVYLAPGVHKFIATFQNFTPDKKTIEINNYMEVLLSPKADSSEAKSYLASNQDIQQEYQSQGDSDASTIQTAIRDKYPFLNQLPIETRNFIVAQAAPRKSKSTTSDPAIALEVTALTPQDRLNAVGRIRDQLGIDPSSIEIYFIDMNNVFSGAQQ